MANTEQQWKPTEWEKSSKDEAQKGNLMREKMQYFNNLKALMVLKRKSLREPMKLFTRFFQERY